MALYNSGEDPRAAPRRPWFKPWLTRKPLALPPGPGLARRGFVTTRWSLVLDAGQHVTPEARRALSELCELYRPPIYEFIRRKVGSPEKAEDLTQGFFARLLAKNDLAVADPSRGRFRHWLKACVTHYLANERTRARAMKRGGDWFQLDLDGAEYDLHPSASRLTPERAFERRWAVQLLERVLVVLGEEYARRGKSLRFNQLKETLSGDEGVYPRLAAEWGVSVGAVGTAACRFRKRYGVLLREELAHTVENRRQIDDELRFLMSAFEEP